MTKTLHDHVPEFIRKIDPYRPGKPVEEVERELKIRAVKLASNENPLGPSPLAVEAVRKYVAECHRYPDGGGYYLREKLAQRHGVPMENIFLGEGSSELIDLAARILLKPGEEGLTSDGTFPLYRISILAAGGTLIKIPLKDYAFDLDAMARAVTPQTRVIYLANPNNPTGTMFSLKEFEAFFRKVSDTSEALVVLDEAYCDYVESEDFSVSLHLACTATNLLVLRTFSKVYGLAGMRIGYGVGPVGLLVEMNKLRTPFNTSNVAQAAAFAALDDAAHVQRSRESNRAGMQQMTSRLDALGVKYIPSYGNFVLVEMGRDSKDVATALLKLGVIVRPMAWMGFPTAIRVTVGTAEENARFLEALPKAMQHDAEAKRQGK
ncbi:MAG TPA: histidinol-phosphate transaminase [Candidatus Acidoferrales bacterium]|nr:histidinol-phosphate transaminase [Candidatus Acidoferrales bacterium]